MNPKVLDLTVAILNWALERSRNDPISAGKIERGEPLTLVDLQRLGDARDSALADLEDELDS